MVIDTVKPSAVAVGVPKDGFNAVPTTDVCVTVFEPPVYPVRVVVIVAVELVPGATPVMVAKPVPSPLSMIPTVPDAVAVPAHV